MARFAAIALASLSSLTLTACFENTYDVSESKLLLRYLPAEDALLILEVEHGIQEGGKSPDPVQPAAVALRGIADGARVFPASGEWIATDFDELVRDSANNSDMTDQDRAELRELRDAIHVQDRGLFLEDETTLSLFRLTRLEHLGRMFEIFNGGYNRKLQKPSETERPFEPGFPIFDEESWKMFRSEVAQNHAWLALKDNAIVLEMPMTSANAARCLATIARDCPKDENSEALAQLAEQVSGLEITGLHARLRFGEKPREVLRFTYHSRHAGSGEDLIARLKSLGVKLGGADAARQALAKVEGPPPAPLAPK
jgi:hypothetical protein